MGCAQFPGPSETEAEPEAPAPEIIPDQDPELVPAQEPTTEVTPAPEPESDPIPPGGKTLPYKAVGTLRQGATVTVTGRKGTYAQLKNGLYILEALLEVRPIS